MTETAEAVENPGTDDSTPLLRPWEDVLPDNFQMLRLAALPTDRATGPRPLRFVQFGHVERHSRDLSLLRMNIQLPGQHVRPEQNRLDIWVDHQQQMVSFSPDSGLQTEPWNRGLGRFMVAQGLHWAQKHWGTYRLERFELPSKDGLNPDTRLRRDHFLDSLGFEVEYADTHHMKGTTNELLIGNLNGGWNTDKVQPMDILDTAQMLEKADQKMQEQEATIRKHEERVNQYKREDSGLRFTIACLVTFAVFQAGLLIWIATHS